MTTQNNTPPAPHISPQDISAETAVLSAMMIDPDAVAKAIEILKDCHFYDTRHRVIFAAMADLFEKNVQIDLITLIHRIEEKGEIDIAGGKPYINEISDAVYTSAHLENHAKIVLDKAIQRMLLYVSNQITKNVYESGTTTAEMLDFAESKIFEIAELPNKQTMITLKTAIADTFKLINELARTGQSIVGLPTGFYSLDTCIGGFKKGQFIVIAARPGMGKSSFALNIAQYLTYSLEKKVALFSLEMGRDEIAMRFLSTESGISVPILQNGQLINHDYVYWIERAKDALSTTQMYIDDDGFNTLMTIKAKARRIASEMKGLDIIIIDYLQLMEGSSNKNDSNYRYLEISEISRGLKVLAKEMNIPVIALSQLNRNLENRGNKRPMLSDLRESGAIEQDTDIVLFIYRDEIYNKSESNKKQGFAEIEIAKNRHGPSGCSVILRFDKTITKFSDATPDEESAYRKDFK